MTTVTMEYTKTPKFSLLPVLIILLAVTGGLLISHGVAKHRMDAVLTRNCLDKYGIDFSYFKTDTRNVQLCLIEPKEDGFYALGIRVLEKINGKWEELTAYVNRNITTIDGAIDYMEVDMGKYGYVSFIRDVYKGLLIH